MGSGWFAIEDFYRGLGRRFDSPRWLGQQARGYGDPAIPAPVTVQNAKAEALAYLRQRPR